MHRAIHLVCLLALCAASAFSQTFGEITGEVRDSSGAVIGGANVTITNAGTNAARTTVTNEAGVYSFPALNPGTYNLKVDKAGFKTVTQTSIELQVQFTPVSTSSCRSVR